MREVKYYVAWDDSEFETKKECLEYERKAIATMATVDECYTFFDKNGERMMAPISDVIEDWLNWLSIAADQCKWIRVHRPISKTATKFINREWGYCICPEDFESETGFFEYDYLKNEWVKVGE